MGAYQFKIIIKGSKPPIWRRMLVPQGTTFEMLHQMIQCAFCWSDCHLYEFDFRTRGICITDRQLSENAAEDSISAESTIDELVSDTKKFTYTYDFGDNWVHVIEVEKLIEDDTTPYARVIKYKGGIIPENCGGIDGYYRLLEDAAQESETASENAAGVFTLPEYDMESVNTRLTQLTVSGAVAVAKRPLTLKTIWSYYDKNSLIELAKRHAISGCSALKKDELITKLSDAILEPEIMTTYLLCARDAEIRLFEGVLNGEHFVPYYEAEDLDYLYAGGYITEEENANHYYAAIEVKEAYDRINTESFRIRRKRLSVIGDYLCAANALYAVTPISVVLDIFNRYEPLKLTEEELLSAWETLYARRPVVKLINESFIDCVLAEEHTYEDFCARRRNVPYYIPQPQEIRFMADNNGFLMNRHLEQLGSFLIDDVSIDSRSIPSILFGVQSAISVGADLQTVVDRLEEADVIFSTKEQLEKFTSIITDVWNNTRMVLNRGYTPHELVTNGLETTSGQRVTAAKIYPNDPCPCGSGKKYKKCCGKRR